MSLYNQGPVLSVKPEGKLTKWTRVLLPSAPGVIARLQSHLVTFGRMGA